MSSLVMSYVPDGGIPVARAAEANAWTGLATYWETKPMRLMSLLGSMFAIGLFIYAFASFAMVSAVIDPVASRPKAEEKALPLEQAAPEIVKLRPALAQLAAKAKEMVPFCPNRDEESEPARPRGKVLVWDVENKDVSEA